MTYGATPPLLQINLNKRNIITNNLKGWYFYSFSSEPFIVSAVSTYIPLLLEHFARKNGVQVDNHQRPCDLKNNDRCVLPMFSNHLLVDTSSFPLYTFSISVMFQTVTVITISGIVDHWNSIKLKGRVLVGFSILGAIATFYISRLNDSQIYMLPFLYILTNSCFGVINVVGNSMLPVIVDSVVLLDHSRGYGLDCYNDDNNMETIVNDSDSFLVSIEKATNVISGRGASIGYSSALLVQSISVLLIRHTSAQNEIQIGLAFCGLWWLIWQSPMIWLFKDLETEIDFSDNTHGPLNQHESSKNKKSWSWKNLIYGWSSLWESLKHAKLLKDVIIFLVSWFIISDSTTTINSTAILFSKTELNMSTLSLVIISIITMCSAMIGAFGIPLFFTRSFNFLPHQILIIIICWTMIIPFYGLLGFFFENIGLKHKGEMYVLAVWYGLSMGSLSAVSRSVFALIIPSGKESTFFSLFSITDKGSSIMGPFLVGLLTDKTHNIRYAFFLLFTLLLSALPFLQLLDVQRGKREAQKLSTIGPN